MAEEAISSNKRIAKNTIMLYIRMLLSMVVSLYTSRVVLNTLGVEDFGIYGVVGGVVAMFGFLNASMSGATSRFLTYEMGRGDEQRLRDTFSSALLVHIGIALVVLFLAETVGLWFLMHKLVIPEERMFAAHVVYQLSVLSAMVGITQVPYNATIIAHEKMDIYAYVELLNVSLKLLIVFLLPVLGHDKLIVYGILVFAVSVLIALIYRWYCFNRYQESHFCFIFNKNIIYPMLSFSGWDLYGNMSVSYKQQGINFLINIFFGPSLNAASAIATTVQGVISNLARNITMAYRPQIIKSYAEGNLMRMQELFIFALILTSAVLHIIVIPLFLNAEFIFSLWLKNVPDYSIIFFRLVALSNVVATITFVVNIPIHATGKIKLFSFMTGTIHLMTLLPIYILFKMKFGVEFAYIVQICVSVLLLMADLYILKRNIPILNFILIVRNILLSFSVFLFTFLLVYILSFSFDNGWLHLFMTIIFTVTLYSLLFYLILLDKQRKLQVKKMLKKVFVR